MDQHELPSTTPLSWAHVAMMAVGTSISYILAWLAVDQNVALLSRWFSIVAASVTIAVGIKRLLRDK